MQAKVRRVFYVSSLILASLAILFLVVASPLSLSLLARSGSNWTLLSNIGQTYGAISALLTAVGLSGVAVTIILQIRESRRSRADAIRSHHFDLFRIAMEDPDLSETSGGLVRLQHKERKQAIYTNLQLEFWLMLWEIDSLPEPTLRGYAEDLFSAAPGRRYWERLGQTRARLATGARKEARFIRVVNEEYLKIVHSTPSVSTRSERKIAAKVAVGTVTSTAVALIIEGLIRRSIGRQK